MTTSARKSRRRMKWTPAPGRTLPAGARRVDGNTIYHHKFAGQGGSRAKALEMFRRWLAAPAQREFRNLIRSELSGKVLSCSCPATDPLCHVVALLEVVDSPHEPPPAKTGRRRR
jgi:hypothetical protein